MGQTLLFTYHGIITHFPCHGRPQEEKQGDGTGWSKAGIGGGGGKMWWQDVEEAGWGVGALPQPVDKATPRGEGQDSLTTSA